MAKYLPSDKILVYPALNRVTRLDESVMLTERNLIRLINQLIDKTAFVITDTYSSSSPLEFNIHGYYFKISQVPKFSTDVYAQITLDENEELIGYDDASYYRGVEFLGSASDAVSINIDNGTTTYTLHILEKSGGDWRIPDASKVKFEERSIGNMTKDKFAPQVDLSSHVTTIDGGEL